MPPTGLVMDVVTITTTTVVANGMAVTVVAHPVTGSSFRTATKTQDASAWTQPRQASRRHAQADAVALSLLVMAIVTTTTTIVDVRGMAVTAAGARGLNCSILTARSVHARIQMPNALPSASMLHTKAMAVAMTETIIVAVIGTVAIAVALLATSNSGCIVNSARTRVVMLVSVVTHVALLIGFKTGTVTIRIITAVVSEMEAIVAVVPTNISMHTAPSVNAKILRLCLKRTVVASSVALLGTRAIKYATMKTTTVPVTGMTVTAADKMATNNNAHTAKSVNVSTLGIKVSTPTTHAPVEGNVPRRVL